MLTIAHLLRVVFKVLRNGISKFMSMLPIWESVPDVPELLGAGDAMSSIENQKADSGDNKYPGSYCEG